MMKRVFYILLSALPLISLGMAAKPSQGAKMAADFTSLFQGNGPASSRSPALTWIRSDSAWQKSAYAALVADPGKQPDFSRHDVLVFSMGEFATTGASIELLKIEKGPKTVFHLKGSMPDPKRAHGQMITHPMHMVQTAKGLAEPLELKMNDRPVQYQVHVEE